MPVGQDSKWFQYQHDDISDIKQFSSQKHAKTTDLSDFKDRPSGRIEPQLFGLGMKPTEFFFQGGTAPAPELGSRDWHPGYTWLRFNKNGCTWGGVSSKICLTNLVQADFQFRRVPAETR